MGYVRDGDEGHVYQQRHDGDGVGHFMFRLGQFWYVGPTLGTESGVYLRAPVQEEIDSIWIDVSGTKTPPPERGWQYHAGNNTSMKNELGQSTQAQNCGGFLTWLAQSYRLELQVRLQSSGSQEVRRREAAIGLASTLQLPTSGTGVERFSSMSPEQTNTYLCHPTNPVLGLLVPPLMMLVRPGFLVVQQAPIAQAAQKFPKAGGLVVRVGPTGKGTNGMNLCVSLSCVFLFKKIKMFEDLFFS